MIRPHPAECTCNCHANPSQKRMELVRLQEDEAVNHRCYSRAVLKGFANPNGFRCRDCGQFYGVDQATNQLRPIEGDQTFGPHPGMAPSRFPTVAPLGWRLLNWVTPAFAPAGFQVMIRDGIRPPAWEIVTVWTMA